MSGVFGGGGLTNYQNGLESQGGASQNYGLPNLPGMGEQPKYFPNAAAAAVDYAKKHKAEEIPMNIDGQFDPAGNSDLSASSGPAQGGSPNANIKRPGFLDVLRQGGDNISNPGLSKGGKLMGAILSMARGAAIGSAGGGFAGGGQLAQQSMRQEKQDRENEVLRRIGLARQQQQDARAAAEDQSQAALRQAQIGAYNAQTTQRSEPKPDPRHVVGGALVDDNGRVIYQTPAKPVKAGGGGKRATPAQSAQIERQKQAALARAEADFRNPERQDIYGNAQELQRRKQEIQDAYIAQIEALGGSAANDSGAPPKGAKIRDYTQLGQ